IGERRVCQVSSMREDFRSPLFVLALLLGAFACVSSGGSTPVAKQPMAPSQRASPRAWRGESCLERWAVLGAVLDRRGELNRCLAALESRYLGFPLRVGPAGNVLRAEIPSELSVAERACVEPLVLALEFPPCESASELAFVVQDGEFSGYAVLNPNATAEAIAASVDSSVHVIGECYEFGPSERGEFGTVLMEWTIEGTRAIDIEFVRNDFNDEQFDRCLVQAIEHLRVDTFVPEGIVVRYPFSFRTAD
ncbi:MAG: hypothetical protein AAFY60_15425, partial [Myxococcota bacterium]